MEDDDSGIFQSSKIEDSLIVANDSSMVSDVVTEESGADFQDKEDSDALSSLSEDISNNGTSTDDYESDSHVFDEEDVLFSTSALQESYASSNNRTTNHNNSNNAIVDGSFQQIKNQTVFTEKKKLSIDDALVDLHMHDGKASIENKTDILKSLGNLFSRGKNSNKEATQSLHETKITYKDGERAEHWEFKNTSVQQNDQDQKKKIKSNDISPKKVLKLQLSELSSGNCESKNASNEAQNSMNNTQLTTDTIANELTHKARSNSSTIQLPVSDFMNRLLFELRDPDELQCSKWKRIFVDCNNVVVSCQQPLEGELGYDAVVIPGNSFGFLDGEPEIEYTNTFGWNLQDELQDFIKREHDGELIVGNGLIRPLDPSSGVKYAIYVPVMRVPLDVSETANAYLAFKAAIKMVKIHNESCMKEDSIISVLCPALCNGFGRMPPARIALQMRTAYDTFAGGERGRFIYSEDLGAMATNHVNMTTKIGKWY